MDYELGDWLYGMYIVMGSMMDVLWRGWIGEEIVWRWREVLKFGVFGVCEWGMVGALVEKGIEIYVSMESWLHWMYLEGSVFR